jgi:hypothetical protein
MKVAIDQARGKKKTFHIDNFDAIGIIPPHAGNPFPGDGDIDGVNFSRKNIDDLPASQKEVRRPIPFGDVN